jgi:molecular chaperone DnaK
VTFDIDANGILHVNAKDLGTGKEQKITITASSGLSKDEIEKMRKDAEAHAEEDRQQRESVEARNEADNLIYRTEKMLKENKEKLPADETKKIESAVENVKEALKGTDTAAIKSAVEKLNEAWQAVSELIYKSGQAQGGKGPGGPTPGSADPGQKSKPDDDVIDAEVVDEKKS